MFTLLSSRLLLDKQLICNASCMLLEMQAKTLTKILIRCFAALFNYNCNAFMVAIFYMSINSHGYGNGDFWENRLFTMFHRNNVYCFYFFCQQ